MKLKYFYTFICIPIIILSCVKDKPNPDVKQLPSNTSNGMLLLNEGSYGNNNAELSFIDLKNKQVSNAIFKTMNGKSLGDVAQSITLINGRYYIAINNSNQVIVIDTSNFSLITTIENIKFPRYLTQVSQDIVYISSLYMPYVYVLQLSTNTVIDTIITDHPNTEQMLVVNDIAWICNWDTSCDYLYKIDISTNQLLEKVTINGFAPHDILQDKNGMIWILSGNKYKNKASKLSCINPSTNAIVKSIAFLADEDPIRLSINAARDTIYYINVNYDGNASNNGLYRMGILEDMLPISPMIQAPSNTYFWAIGIDPNTSHIYLSDPKGFTQSSTVYEYTNIGNLLHTFQTGIGTNQFVFK